MIKFTYAYTIPKQCFTDDGEPLFRDAVIGKVNSGTQYTVSEAEVQGLLARWGADGKRVFTLTGIEHVDAALIPDEAWVHALAGGFRMGSHRKPSF